MTTATLDDQKIPVLYRNGKGDWIMLGDGGEKYEIAMNGSPLERAMTARLSQSAIRSLIEECVHVCEDYAREGRSGAKEYTYDTAAELAARIRALSPNTSSDSVGEGAAKAGNLTGGRSTQSATEPVNIPEGQRQAIRNEAIEECAKVCEAVPADHYDPSRHKIICAAAVRSLKDQPASTTGSHGDKRDG